MTSAAHALLRGSLLIILLAGGMVWTSCDLASAGNTVILSASSPIEPTVQHRFEYKGEDVVDGTVTVKSEIQSDDLDTILSRNGFARRDVVDARVDSVQVERVPAPSPLRDVELFLGREGPRVARVQFSPEGRSTIVDNMRRTVTRAVQDGAEVLDGRFELETPEAGVVRARVYYRLEVEGV